MNWIRAWCFNAQEAWSVKDFRRAKEIINGAGVAGFWKTGVIAKAIAKNTSIHDAQPRALAQFKELFAIFVDITNITIISNQWDICKTAAICRQVYG